MGPISRVSFRLALCGLLFLLFQPLLHAQAKIPHRHDGRHQIDQMEELWRAAVLHADTGAMSNLLSDDYIAITPSGTLQTKEQALEKIRAGKVHVTVLDIVDRKVRFYAKTAVVTSQAYMEGTNPEGEISGHFRYTRVYVKNSDGVWKIVSFEASRLRAHGQPH